MSNLPDVQFAETDAATVEASVIVAYEAIAGRTLAPGDPVRLFLESVAALLVQQRVVINFAARQNLLSYAGGTYLDALAELVGVSRLPAQPASATVRFTLSGAQAFVVSIPAGSRVAAGSLFFETADALEVPVGETSGTVAVRCTVAGTAGNGLVPGQIRTIVNPTPYVSSVSNTTATAGGADVEGDENLRARIRLAPGSFSVAGPASAYVYWTRSASQAVTDVSVRSPSPGVVEVRPLLANGEIPTQTLLDDVAAFLRDEPVRPLTDEVNVLAPTAVAYTVDVTYWIDSARSGQAVNIQAAVTQAVEDYKAWQRAAIGRDVNPDELLTRIKAAGAKRATITAPAFTVLDATQVAQASATSVSYQGLEDA